MEWSYCTVTITHIHWLTYIESVLLICQIVIQFQVIILPSIRIETALLFLLLFKNILKEVGNWTNSGCFFAQNGLLWAWLSTVSSHRRKKVSVLHCGSEIYAIFCHLKLFEKHVFIRYAWVNPNVKKKGGNLNHWLNIMCNVLVWVHVVCATDHSMTITLN